MEHSSPPKPLLSVVIPVRDEVDSLEEFHGALVDRLAQSLPPSVCDVEFLFVDDGSRDGSSKMLRSLALIDRRVRHLCLGERNGQSSAIWAGLQASRGGWIATIDADLQHDPADLIPMLERLAAGSCDVVLGYRYARHDSWLRRWSSRLANAVRRRALGDGLRDAGCSLKVLRREAAQDLIPFDGLHRFLGTLLVQRGWSVEQRPVQHFPRRHGKTKYGVSNRLVRGVVDLWGVRWLERRRLRARWVESVPAMHGNSGEVGPRPMVDASNAAE